MATKAGGYLDRPLFTRWFSDVPVYTSELFGK